MDKFLSVSLAILSERQEMLTLNTVYTLSKFGSLTLVTTTVTRKMFSMVLSVVAFGHSLSMAQWGGIGLVFGGIGGEAYMGYQEKQAKSAKKDGKKV